MVIKLSMYVYRSTWRISSDGCKFGILKASEMTTACNIIYLGEKMLDKEREKKKKERKIYWLYMIAQKKGAKFARCAAVFFGEAE